MATVRPVGLPPGRDTGGTSSVWRFFLVLSLVLPLSLVSPVDSKKIFSPPPAQPIIMCSLNVIVCGANGQMYPCREMAPKGMTTTTDLSKCRPPGDVIVTPSEAQCPVKAPKVCASDGRNYPCADVAPKGLLTTTDLSACQTPATCPWSTSAYSKSSLALLATACSTLNPSSSSSSTPLPITSSLIGCCAATSALLQSTAIATAKVQSPRVNTPAVYDARAGQCMKEFVPFVQSPKAAFAAATAAAAAALSKFNPVLQCGRLGFGAAQFGLEGGKGACRGITTEAQLTSALKASPVWWVSSYMKKDCSSTTGSNGRCSDCAKQVSTLFDALVRPRDSVPQKHRCWALMSYYAASSLGNSTAQSNGIAFCLHKNAPASLLPPGTSIKTATITAPTIKPAATVKPPSLPPVKPTIKAAFDAADFQPIGDTLPRQQVLDASPTSTFRAAADTSPSASSAPSTSVRSTSATAIILASVALAVLLAAVVAATILAVRGARHHMHRQRLASSISVYPSGSVSAAALSAGTPLKASVSSFHSPVRRRAPVLAAAAAAPPSTPIKLAAPKGVEK
ncbi:unnamed protein product [Closterium sp. NIES-64]|nr:unnamed protein product [Closterium sp. NIES-64]